MAQQVINNGETGLVVRTKINENFTERYQSFGWSDYNDAATAIAPISIPASPSNAKLTNDELGAFTNKIAAIPANGEIWDASLNVFDWSSLKIGDVVNFRVDLRLTTASPNTKVIVRLKLAHGSGSDYYLNVYSDNYKLAVTDDQVTFLFSIYMGDNNTLQNPAFFTIEADAVGSSVKVGGWFVTTLVR